MMVQPSQPPNSITQGQEATESPSTSPEIESAPNRVRNANRVNEELHPLLPYERTKSYLNDCARIFVGNQNTRKKSRKAVRLCFECWEVFVETKNHNHRGHLSYTMSECFGTDREDPNHAYSDNVFYKRFFNRVININGNKEMLERKGYLLMLDQNNYRIKPFRLNKNTSSSSKRSGRTNKKIKEEKTPVESAKESSKSDVESGKYQKVSGSRKNGSEKKGVQPSTETVEIDAEEDLVEIDTEKTLLAKRAPPAPVNQGVDAKETEMEVELRRVQKRLKRKENNLRIAAKKLTDKEKENTNLKEQLRVMGETLKKLKSEKNNASLNNKKINSVEVSAHNNQALASREQETVKETISLVETCNKHAQALPDLKSVSIQAAEDLDRKEQEDELKSQLLEQRVELDKQNARLGRVDRTIGKGTVRIQNLERSQDKINSQIGKMEEKLSSLMSQNRTLQISNKISDFYEGLRQAVQPLVAFTSNQSSLENPSERINRRQVPRSRNQPSRTFGAGIVGSRRSRGLSSHAIPIPLFGGGLSEMKAVERAKEIENGAMDIEEDNETERIPGVVDVTQEKAVEVRRENLEEQKEEDLTKLVDLSKETDFVKKETSEIVIGEETHQQVTQGVNMMIKEENLRDKVSNDPVEGQDQNDKSKEVYDVAEQPIPANKAQDVYSVVKEQEESPQKSNSESIATQQAPAQEGLKNEEEKEPIKEIDQNPENKAQKVNDELTKQLEALVINSKTPEVAINKPQPNPVVSETPITDLTQTEPQETQGDPKTNPSSESMIIERVEHTNQPDNAQGSQEKPDEPNQPSAVVNTYIFEQKSDVEKQQHIKPATEDGIKPQTPVQIKTKEVVIAISDTAMMEEKVIEADASKPIEESNEPIQVDKQEEKPKTPEVVTNAQVLATPVRKEVVKGNEIVSSSENKGEELNEPSNQISSQAFEDNLKRNLELLASTMNQADEDSNGPLQQSPSTNKTNSPEQKMETEQPTETNEPIKQLTFPEAPQTPVQVTKPTPENPTTLKNNSTVMEIEQDKEAVPEQTKKTPSATLPQIQNSEELKSKIAKLKFQHPEKANSEAPKPSQASLKNTSLINHPSINQNTNNISPSTTTKLLSQRITKPLPAPAKSTSGSLNPKDITFLQNMSTLNHDAGSRIAPNESTMMVEAGTSEKVITKAKSVSMADSSTLSLKHPLSMANLQNTPQKAISICNEALSLANAQIDLKGISLKKMHLDKLKKSLNGGVILEKSAEKEKTAVSVGANLKGEEMNDEAIEVVKKDQKKVNTQ